LIAGVIFDPVRDELFTAERGSGAFQRQAGSRFRAAKLADSLVATGFPAASGTCTQYSLLPSALW
jgi:myo-inositol-1(or 4)-monophosphatase